MFNDHQKYTGTSYTTTVAWGIAAIFSPVVLFLTAPSGYWTTSTAIASSALCAAIAWVTWARSSRLSIPSLPITGRKPK